MREPRVEGLLGERVVESVAVHRRSDETGGFGLLQRPFYFLFVETYHRH
jgi:hypothetical protein